MHDRREFMQLATLLALAIPATLQAAAAVPPARGEIARHQLGGALSGYDAVLGTVRGDTIEKSVGILKPGGRIVSLIGPLDAAFARARHLNFFLAFVFGLMSRKIMGLARSRGADYSFLFVRPSGQQLGAIGDLLQAGRIQPVIDKVFPFDQAKEALEYLAQGRAKGKVVVQVR